MHYWRQESFERLECIKEIVGGIPELTEYMNYVDLLGRGLRKEALQYIDKLLLVLDALPADRQRYLASILYRVGEYQPGHRLLPDPLHRNFLKPVIGKWVIEEQDNAEPLRWTGDLKDLIRSLELDPSCDDTRRRVILKILGFVGFSTHELPHGYLGVVEDDRDLLRVAREQTGLLRDNDLREKYIQMINEEEREIDEYRNRSG